MYNFQYIPLIEPASLLDIRMLC